MAKRANGAGADTGRNTGRGTVLPTGDIIPPNGGLLRPPWKPGQSGNPAGLITTAYHEARAICAEATPKAARKQVELIGSADERVAFMATEAVLNRGAGRPRDHSDEDKQRQRVDLSALSPDERASLAALLVKALGIRQ
jgi:hypothetical protein